MASDSATFNQFDYIAHLNKINSADNLASKIEAYEEFSNNLALTPDLWLDYISLVEDCLSKDGLFERALKEYLSIEVWIAFLGHQIETKEPMEIIQSFEEGVDAFRFQLDDFWRIGKAYLDYDTQNQNKLFKRFLKIPHRNHEETFEAFRQWLRTNLKVGEDYDDQIWKLKKFGGYDQAVQRLTQLQAEFESVQSNGAIDYNVLNSVIYQIMSAKKNKDAQIQAVTLLEKLIATNYANPELWNCYLDFAQQYIDNGDCYLKVLARSIRNVFWIARQWIEIMLAMEVTLKNSQEELDFIFEKAEQAMTYFQVFYQDIEQKAQLLLYKCQRAIRLHNDNSQKFRAAKVYEILDASVEQLQPSHVGDIMLVYQNFIWSDPEADQQFIIFEKNATINERFSNMQYYSNYWLAYAECFISRSEVSKACHLLSSAFDLPDFIQRVDQPQLVFSAYEICHNIYIGQGQNTSARVIRAFFLKCRRLSNQIALRRYQESKNHKYPPIKKARLHNANQQELSIKREAAATVAQPAKKIKVVEKPPIMLPVEQPQRTDEPKNSRTIYVSHLKPAITDELLRNFFSSCGQIQDVRIVRDWNKRKTFAFVEFQQAQSVGSALLLDQSFLKYDDASEFAVYVDKYGVDHSQPSKSGNQKKSQGTIIFVDGLPASVDDQIIKELFMQCGETSRVHLVAGDKLKGKNAKHPFAYIQFKQADSVQAALSLSGLQLTDDRTKIRVRISDKPFPFTKDQMSSQAKPTVKLVPRVLQQPTDNQMAVDVQLPKPKTQEELRQLVLK